LNYLVSLPHTDISKLTCQTVNTSSQYSIVVKCPTLGYSRNELKSRMHLSLIWLTNIKSLFETTISRRLSMKFWKSLKEMKTFLIQILHLKIARVRESRMVSLLKRIFHFISCFIWRDWWWPEKYPQHSVSKSYIA